MIHLRSGFADSSSDVGRSLPWNDSIISYQGCECAHLIYFWILFRTCQNPCLRQITELGVGNNGEEMNFSPEISVAKLEDIEELTRVINKSYKGDGKGWTDFSFVFHDIPRINEIQMENYMKNPNSAFIKYTGDDNAIVGCLFLEDIGERKFHLWCMAVEPSKQSQGIGRKLLEASVNYARYKKFKLIEFTTSARRPDVVAWYERCGFTKTGRIIEFDLSSVIAEIKETRVVREVEFVKYL